MGDTAKSGRMWMWSLVAAIAGSILFFVGFAVWTFQDDVELVYDNYYAKDVVFDQQIKRIARTEALRFKPRLEYKQSAEILELNYPLALGHTPSEGTILLFRPADLHQDRLFSLALQGDSLQTIPLPDLLPGLWRIKLDWTSGGEEYYLEQALIVH